MRYKFSALQAETLDQSITTFMCLLCTCSSHSIDSIIFDPNLNPSSFIFLFILPMSNFTDCLTTEASKDLPPVLPQHSFPSMPLLLLSSISHLFPPKLHLSNNFTLHFPDMVIFSPALTSLTKMGYPRKEFLNLFKSKSNLSNQDSLDRKTSKKFSSRILAIENIIKFR